MLSHAHCKRTTIIAAGLAATLWISIGGLVHAGQAEPNVERSIDGSGNNLANSQWGSTDVWLLREDSGADYVDGISIPITDSRPTARLISNTVSAQDASKPNSNGLTDMVWLWGQFVDHDLDLTDNADPAEAFNIAVPQGDPYFDPDETGVMEIGLNRSIYDTSTGTDASNPRQQVNQITAWLDGSNVYGSDDDRAAWLRSGTAGKLKVQSTAVGDLLPFNDGTQANAGGSSTSLFVAGDIRANENILLTSMHTLWVREHNRVAEQIATANPHMGDEAIYQAARSWVIAEMQAITFNEWLPSLLGDGSIPEYSGYDSTVNPNISNAFSTAAFRVGHTMLSPELQRLNNDGTSVEAGALALRDAFFSPGELTDEANGGIEALLLGACSQLMQEVDEQVIDDVRNFLFGQPGQGGFDLASLNIQRGRDHGLADYNTMRVDFGLDPVTSFSDITDDADLQLALADLYGTVDNIDAWVGGLIEDPFGESVFGELFHTVILDQFLRLRDGDRFWYENIYSGDELAALQNTTLYGVIDVNTSMEGGLPINVFAIPEPASAALLAGGVLLLLPRRRDG